MHITGHVPHLLMHKKELSSGGGGNESGGGDGGGGGGGAGEQIFGQVSHLLMHSNELSSDSACKRGGDAKMEMTKTQLIQSAMHFVCIALFWIGNIMAWVVRKLIVATKSKRPIQLN